MNKPVKPIKQVNIYEAKTQLSRLVDQASKGESFVIAKAGVPVARLVPLEHTDEPKKKFKFGTMKGKIWMADDFDAPLPDWLLDAFEGKSDESEHE
jgi:prevent-host-death family protein